VAAAQTDVSAGPAPAQSRAEADTTASPMADAAEAMEAEAAQAAADRGADLVTRGGQSPRDVTVIVESPGVPEAAATPPAAEAPAPAPTPVVERPAPPAPAAPERPAREELRPAASARPNPTGPTLVRPAGPQSARPGGPDSARPGGPQSARPGGQGPQSARPGGPQSARPGGPPQRPGQPAQGGPPRPAQQGGPGGDRRPSPPPSVRPGGPSGPRPARPEGQGAPSGDGRGAPPRPEFVPRSARSMAPPMPPARTQSFGGRPGDGGGPVNQGGGGAAGGNANAKKKDRKKKKGRGTVDQTAVDDNFRKTMAAMESGGGRKKRRGQRDQGPSQSERREEEIQRRRAEEATTVRVNEFLTVAELAELIDVPATQLIGSAFKNLGLMVTINQRLDFDQIELLLDEFGFKAVREEEYAAEMEESVEEDAPEDLQARPPVVTVMGHVDHGKTSLLDYIRKTNVIAGEAGGITQHIGAYHVQLPDGRAISFLDTPGHAAFTAMRARGAEVTDVVILVVAADDSVMPQTVEAISHARNAGVPLIVAVNKVDLPDANPMKVKQDLLQHGVVLEDFGGDVMSAEVSAKKGQGMDELLEKVLLLSDIQELRANPDREAVGTVIEAQLDVGKGPVATVLVTNGTLRVGDHVVCGMFAGRIRAMLDERNRPVQQAGPAIPVQILGLPGVPGAGDQLIAMEADRAAEIAQTRQRLEREKRMRIKSRGVKLMDLSRMLAKGEQAQLNLVIKGDVDGSVQALSDSLEQLSTAEVRVQVVHRGVGAINESDVLLASTSGAIVVGFHVRPTGEARNVAEREDVDIRLYNIIYEAVAEVRAAMEGLLSPEEREIMLGTAEVRQLFKVPRVGTVAGCMVTSGVLDRRGKIRVVRDAVQVYEGELGSLKRFKDDAREVREGFECGLNINNFNDIKVGDILECYRVEEVARTLAGIAAEQERERANAPA
ncbi:translation initiation factor IF-2, partial [Longimicrobium sp.]|uniref:translation initiation factor IF-2 n=1 Tax=Longimicrobium sp. TaxID=2029185 RepID=UPI002E34CA6A